MLVLAQALPLRIPGKAGKQMKHLNPLFYIWMAITGIGYGIITSELKLKPNTLKYWLYHIPYTAVVLGIGYLVFVRWL